MTTAFKELGIKPKLKAFTGDKIKIDRVLNKEIKILDYEVTDSKFTDKCLKLQIEVDNQRRIVFTGSKILRDMIEQVPQERFPITTTIIRSSDHFEFE